MSKSTFYDQDSAKALADHLEYLQGTKDQTTPAISPSKITKQDIEKLVSLLQENKDKKITINIAALVSPNAVTSKEVQAAINKPENALILLKHLEGSTKIKVNIDTPDRKAAFAKHLAQKYYQDILDPEKAKPEQVEKLLADHEDVIRLIEKKEIEQLIKRANKLHSSVATAQKDFDKICDKVSTDPENEAKVVKQATKAILETRKLDKELKDIENLQAKLQKQFKSWDVGEPHNLNTYIPAKIVAINVAMDDISRKNTLVNSKEGRGQIIMSRNGGNITPNPLHRSMQV